MDAELTTRLEIERDSVDRTSWQLIKGCVKPHLSRRPIARRDPMFASLGHARHAAILGQTGDHRAVRQAVAHAEDALARSEPSDERPLWLNAFYDQADFGSALQIAAPSSDPATAWEHYAHDALRKLL